MSTALAQRQDLLPDASTWSTMLDMAKTLVESGMLPSSIKTPAAALAIIQKGRELGIPPMYALSNISLINGRPVTGAEVFLAMIYRDHGDNAVQFEETSAERCAVVYRRRGWSAPRRFEWTVEDAKAAGLIAKGGTWNQYRPAMLRHRCVSAIARMAFPDSIGGLYTAEELGAEVEVNDQGEVVVVEQSPAPVRLVKPADVIEPEPDATGNERARAMVGDWRADPSKTSLREQAVIRYHQLAQVAKEAGHAKADQIASVAPESLSDPALGKAVKRLEELFPGVAEPEYPLPPAEHDDQEAF
jgi:hypothetical protein